MQNKYAAAILCGGQSRRMGFDKALFLADAGGGSLLAALAEKLSSRFEEVILIADRADKFANRPDLNRFKVFSDLHPNAGPAGGIHTALRACPGRAFFIMACDMPEVDYSLIDALQSLLETEEAAAAIPRRGDRIEPLYGFYGPETEKVLRESLEAGQRSVRDSLGRLKTAYLDLDDAEGGHDIFANLNRTDDVQKAGLNMIGAGYTKILRYERGCFEERDDLVIAENRVELVVNNVPLISVMATPQNLDDLAVGLLFGEGIIKSAEEVKSVDVLEGQVRVALLSPEPPKLLDKLVRLSGFGAAIAGADSLEPESGEHAAEDCAIKGLTAENVCQLMEEFNERSSLFKQTGATHGVCFVNPADRSKDLFFDDVGRHNALDKVIGRLLRLRESPARGLILTTGRVSVEILLKARRAGLFVLISRSAPTDRAVNLARSLNMTLIGFARGRSFNIYAGAERIS